MNARQIQIHIKYLFDRVIAALGLLLISPVLIAIGVAIKLDDGGPVFFRQNRIGRGRRVFRVFKFRTMVVNADSLLNAQGGIDERDRITRAGRFLRRWSLDEVPQLVNVLRGEMSFVGPRPVIASHALRYSQEQCRRFEMKPGITGLAQVSGRNTIKWSRRLELDVEYASRYSLGLDAHILWQTIFVVLSHEGLVMDRNPEQVDDLPAAFVLPMDKSANVAA